MSVSLYRKYRPQDFEQIVGQTHVKLTLQNELVTGKISHAYLFSGPHGVGKTTMARILTKALNCRDRKGFEPCNQCSSCLEINEARSLDMIEIDAASNRGINEIRELKEQVKFVPLKESYKVFIIDEVHMLTTEAFNALLKTLEEPPSHVIFVLATTEIQKVPETIISRCQHFDFKKVSSEDIQKYLNEIIRQEEVKVDKKVLANIARQSGGYLRDAVSLLGQILSLGEKEITEAEAELVLPRSQISTILKFLNYLLLGQTAEALKLIQYFGDEGGDLEFFSRQAVEQLRKILLAKATDNWQELLWDLNQESLNELNNSLADWSLEGLSQILQYLIVCLQEIRTAEILSLPLELAVVKVGQLGSGQQTVLPNRNHGSDSMPPVIKQTKSEVAPKKTSIEPELSSDKVQSKVIDDQPIAEDKEPVERPAATLNLSLEQIIEQWPKIINELKAFNHSLASFLKDGLPLRIEDNYLVIGFRYNFHWERVKDFKNKRVVEETLKNIFGQEVMIKGEIDDKLETYSSKAGQKSENMIENVLETLGGEVVN